MCDGISNFEPGMTLGRNSWVFIVIGTATPRCAVPLKLPPLGDGPGCCNWCWISIRINEKIKMSILWRVLMLQQNELYINNQ